MTSAFQRLMRETTGPRETFVNLPLIREVLQTGASRTLYLDFLGQAYHHVKHTAPLLALAAARCGANDYVYQSALFEYIEEERGHELWILEDISVLGGDPDQVRGRTPRLPCKVMVGHAYYVVDHVSPYGLLGMVHVLEGMAVALGSKATASLQASLSVSGDEGFKYLTTHSGLDVKHTEFFEDLFNQIGDRCLPVVIETAADFYKLYGDLFRDLDERRREERS